MDEIKYSSQIDQNHQRSLPLNPSNQSEHLIELPSDIYRTLRPGRCFYTYLLFCFAFLNPILGLFNSSRHDQAKQKTRSESISRDSTKE